VQCAVCGQKVGRQNASRAVPLLKVGPLRYVPTPLQTLIDWLIGWLVGWLVGWLIDWLIDWVCQWVNIDCHFYCCRSFTEKVLNWPTQQYVNTPYILCAKHILSLVLSLALVVTLKLSCRRETARCFVSLDLLLSHSRSLKVIRNDTVEYSIVAVSVYRIVSEIFSVR